MRSNDLPSSAVLRVLALSKSFGSVEAVANTSFDIARDEVLALVGPSGCGKTTLLRMIAGLETPTTGDLLLDGQSIRHRPPANRNVAMVFQDGGLYPHKTVRRNLAYPLLLRHINAARIRHEIDSIAGTLGITPLLDRFPHQLSGGERQRVGVGKALLRNPALFLFDEPLNSVDAHLRRSLRVEIRQVLRARAAPAIFVTHDQDEAMSMGDRVAVMRAGRLLQIGTPQEIYHRPADVFVASFVGDPPMTIVAVEIRDGIVYACQNVPLAHRRELPDGPYRLGVRANDVVVASADRAVGIDARIELLEYRQPRSVVIYETPCGRVTGEGASDMRIGDRTRLMFREDTIVLFEAESSGARVWPSTPVG